MDGFQGAILSVKLNHIDDWNELRRKNAECYNDLLSNINGITIPVEAEYAKHVYHIYPIRIKNRNDLMESLSAKEIYTGIHYPIPVHLMEAYRHLGFGKGSFEITEKCADDYLSLPMFPELKKEQVEFVVNTLLTSFQD